MGTVTDACQVSAVKSSQGQMLPVDTYLQKNKKKRIHPFREHHQSLYTQGVHGESWSDSGGAQLVGSYTGQGVRGFDFPEMFEMNQARFPRTYEACARPELGQ